MGSTFRGQPKSAQCRWRLDPPLLVFLSGCPADRELHGWGQQKKHQKGEIEETVWDMTGHISFVFFQ